MLSVRLPAALSLRNKSLRQFELIGAKIRDKKGERWLEYSPTVTETVWCIFQNEKNSAAIGSVSLALLEDIVGEVQRTHPTGFKSVEHKKR